MALRTGRVIGAVVAFLLVCNAAAAQDVTPDAAAAYRKLGAACAADTARLCPSVAQAPADPRDRLMCLKTYHFDLSLMCRNAMAAVKAATQPTQ
jgi:hypothetical protein